MALSILVFVCILLIDPSSGKEPEKNTCDGCTRLTCESGFIERLVRLEIANEDLERRLALAEQEEPEPVGFKYRFSGDKQVTNGKNLIFDVPVFDRGNAYHAVFTVLVTGTYVITTTICTRNGEWIKVGLNKTGILIGQFIAGDNGYHACNSETTVTELIQGDTVSVHKIAGNSGVLTETYGWNSFNAALVRATSHQLLQ